MCVLCCSYGCFGEGVAAGSGPDGFVVGFAVDDFFEEVPEGNAVLLDCW
jgi:hypothetical protein